MYIRLDSHRSAVKNSNRFDPPSRIGAYGHEFPRKNPEQRLRRNSPAPTRRWSRTSLRGCRLPPQTRIFPRSPTQFAIGSAYQRADTARARGGFLPRAPAPVVPHHRRFAIRRAGGSGEAMHASMHPNGANCPLPLPAASPICSTRDFLLRAGRACRTGAASEAQAAFFAAPVRRRHGADQLRRDQSRSDQARGGERRREPCAGPELLAGDLEQGRISMTDEQPSRSAATSRSRRARSCSKTNSCS